MAQPALDLFRRRTLLGKLEVTEGTDIVPVAGSDAILLKNGRSGTEGDIVDREIDRAFFGNFPFSYGNKRAFVEGDFELFSPSNPGVGLSANNVILRTGGMQSAFTVGNATTTGKTRYTPVSSGIPSASFYWGQSGKRKIILGSRCAISRLGMAVGGRFEGTCRIVGTYANVTDTALPTPTLYATVPPVIRYSNSTMTITNVTDAGSPISCLGKELSIDMGTQMATVEYTTKQQNCIMDRRPSFTMRLSQLAASDFDVWAVRDAGKLVSGVMQVDEGTGLYSQLGFRGQIEGIEEADIDGHYGYVLTGRCIPNAGDDEFWAEFGDLTAAGTP